MYTKKQKFVTICITGHSDEKEALISYQFTTENLGDLTYDTYWNLR